ncbi:MAG: hypothetical protein IPM63_06545 [Acidobacteriota bacterium]|nr:MAG: hypothetical protein IPM63_06545 [Acidobacteriota bacterium]
MKPLKMIKNSLILTFVASLLVAGACQSGSVAPGKASSPTEAYQMLFTAVKSKKPEDIKMMLSKDTLKFAEGAAAQTKKSLDEQIKNGFTRTTFASEMPPIRDERVKDEMGAVEVYNEAEKKWENLPFVLEDGGWKLAVGNLFFGTWKSPGDSRSMKEQKIANTMNGNRLVPYGNTNFNANTLNQTPIVPKEVPNTNSK